MPKVTQEYILNKKKKIIDAAYELCLEKTVSTVTMQDIINRTGLSQGGIYRFYKDIDEIFGDMLADMRQRVTIKDESVIVEIQACRKKVYNCNNCSVFHTKLFVVAKFMETVKRMK